jgi:hypothetical protein
MGQVLHWERNKGSTAYSKFIHTIVFTVHVYLWSTEHFARSDGFEKQDLNFRNGIVKF